MDPAQVGKRLKRAREDAGLDQAQVAERLGIHRITVSRWERGKAKVDASTASKLSEMYSVDLRALLNGQSPQGANVPRETSSDDAWSPNPALRNKIPPRAYETAIEYCRRLARAGVARENIENAERLMIDSRYAQANKREKRELTEDDWILLVDDTWDAIRETLSWEGVRV